MRKERSITINVIENNKINMRLLAGFFIKKYNESSDKKS